MKPLAWVEGKPVYHGDVLWNKIGGYSCEALHASKTSEPILDALLVIQEAREVLVNLTGLTWEKPKVKRKGWINIYQNERCSTIYSSKAVADSGANSDRIDCIEIIYNT